MNTGLGDVSRCLAAVSFRSFRCASVPCQSSLNHHYGNGRRGGLASIPRNDVERVASTGLRFRCLAARPSRVFAMSPPTQARARVRVRRRGWFGGGLRRLRGELFADRVPFQDGPPAPRSARLAIWGNRLASPSSEGVPFPAGLASSSFPLEGAGVGRQKNTRKTENRPALVRRGGLSWRGIAASGR